MYRLLRILTLVGLVLTVAACITGAMVYQASQQVPEFYQRALRQQPVQAEEAGQQFERNVLDLSNDLQNETNWEAIFSADQINGWLASELQKQYPGVLPSGVDRPRVAIDDGVAKLACRYESKRISTVISLNLEIYLTDAPNELAIKVHGAQAGMVPVPLKKMLNRITLRAQKAKLTVRWVQDEGIPTALVKIPENHKDLKRGVLLEALELRPGELFLAGSAQEEASAPDVSATLAVR